ncbi:unnamed protein product, partial [Ilex paraguariensis]
ILELQVQVPEAEMLLDLIKQAESCRSRCNEMLKGSICLKKLELLLLELDGFPVKIPELELLRQYHTDAESWVSRVNDVLVNLHNRDDQENVVDELQCIKRDGELLKIRVDVLPFFEDLEVDLKKALCRVKARKVLRCKMSLDFIQTLLREASLYAPWFDASYRLRTIKIFSLHFQNFDFHMPIYARLQVEKEKLFAEISGLHAVGICWEEKAKHILASEAQMSDFEDLLRTSKDICAILPSLDDVKDAISMAKSWLNKSKPFLVDDIPVALSSSSLLKVDALKDLVSQSKLLKISLRERSTLQTVLNNCLKWEQDACSLLHDAESLLIIENVGDGISSGLLSRIEHQVAAMESALKAILSLGFDLGVIPKLQDACSMLQWCFKALSFCAIAPALEEVEMLLEVTGPLPAIYKSCSLWSSLVDGLNWLKNALEISVPCNLRRFKLSDVEEVCMQSQTINISFPVMVSRLLNAIKRHHLNSRDRSWVLLLELKFVSGIINSNVQDFDPSNVQCGYFLLPSGLPESCYVADELELGSTDAYNCSELDMVSSEVQKVEHWKQRFEEIAGPSVGDHNSNLNVLLEIKSTLDRSLYIYDKSKGREPGCICILCCNDIKDQELLTCSLCMDCFHLGCSGSALENTNDAAIFICPFCHCAKKGKISRNGSGLLRIGGKQPELNDLIELLSLAEDLCICIKEKIILGQIVEKAVACKAWLTERVDFVLGYLDEDLSIAAKNISVALKARDGAWSGRDSPVCGYQPRNMVSFLFLIGSTFSCKQAVEVAGVYDHQGSCKLELALARNSWRVTAQGLLEGPHKPKIQQIQQHLKAKAVACKAWLTERVDFVLGYLDEDLSIAAKNISVALKARDGAWSGRDSPVCGYQPRNMVSFLFLIGSTFSCKQAVEVAGVYDHQGSCKLELALARNSWRVTAQGLLEGPHKPKIQQIQQHLKAGLAISIPPEDYFRQRLTEVRHIGLQWADKAKKVSVDSGALGLDKVFELMMEGENLTIQFDKELKLLRDRSMLYCICRKPYDQRAMIACDKCDEWYHFDCIKLSLPPKIYFCPACKLQTDVDLCASPSLTQERQVSSGSKLEEPQTPSPHRTELRRKSKKPKSRKRKTLVPADSDSLKRSSGTERLLWRNRKPFRRASRKRAELESLSPFFYVRTIS